MSHFLSLISSSLYVSLAYASTGLMMILFLIYMLRQRQIARRLVLSCLKDQQDFLKTPLDSLIVKFHDAAEKTSS